MKKILVVLLIMFSFFDKVSANYTQLAHDFEFKAKHAEGFLADGAKLKVYVQFRGRSIVFKDQGFELMNKFIERMGEDIKVEQPPKMEGRRIVMFIASTKPKK